MSFFSRRVLLIFIIAATAITLSLYYGMQEETKIVLPKKGSILTADGAVKKQVSLILWAVAGNSEAEKIRSRIPSWESALGAKISLRIFASRTDFESARIISARSREAPDVFPVSAADAELFDKSGIIQRIPLSSIDASQWVSQALAPFQRGDNALLAYPSQYSLIVLYYNKADFDRVGIAYPDDQWNWDSLVDVSKALYRPSVGGRPPHYGIEIIPGLGLWNSLSAQLGYPVYSGRQWQLGTPEGDSIQKESLQYLIDFYQKYAFTAPIAQPGKGLFFTKNQASLLIGGSELMKTIRSSPDVNWGVTILPAKFAMDTDRLKRATPLRLRGWAINSRITEEPTLAAARDLAQRLSTIALDGWCHARVVEDEDEATPAVVTQSLPFVVPPYIGNQAPRLYEIVDSLMATFSSASTTTGKFLAKVHTLVEDIKPVESSK